MFSISMCVTVSAQTLDDVLRYSQVSYSGTARFSSMGGAFSALGGDISTLNQNPAGLGVYRSSEITITPQIYNVRSTSSFSSDNNFSEDYLTNTVIPEVGVVVNLIRSKKEKGLISFNFGYSYNRINTYDESSMIKGTMKNSSLADFFADKASTGFDGVDGLFTDELNDPQYNVLDSYLAWSTYLIDTLSGAGEKYGSVFSNYGENNPVYGQSMKRYISQTGSASEHAFSLGGNISNKLYFGTTIGLSVFDYSCQYQHTESTTEEIPSRYDGTFKSFDYVYYYDNHGFGVNLKAGLIYKPINSLRIALAYHTPTLYSIDEYAYDNITSYYTDNNYEEANEPMRFSYKMNTPSRYIVGAAFQLKKRAVFSIDYELVNYRNAKLRHSAEDNYDYSGFNDEIDRSLSISNNIRFGAEVRLAKIFYLRGGLGGTLDSPREKYFSGGAGIRLNRFFCDFAYTHMSKDYTYTLYDTNDYSAWSYNNTYRNIYALTLGFKF